MKESGVYAFIETYITKSAETIDHSYIQEQNDLIIVPIIKQTARTIGKKAELMISDKDSVEIDIPSDIVKIFYSPNVKRTESEMMKRMSAKELFELVSQGVLLKEIRFKKDGKTVESTFYRMGYVLFRYIEIGQKETFQQEQAAIQHWLNRKRALAQCRENEYISKLGTLLDEMENSLQQEQDVDQLPFLQGRRWQSAKVMLYLEFLLALYQIRSEKFTFDWKEIGAVYYREIGGSKKFDAYKHDFLEALEEVLEFPLHYLGLVSLGTVTPILFCGALREEEVHYRYGTVRSITDLAVFRYEYETAAEVVWLVENRAILTRMAAEEGFLEETKSLVIGVDGQLRSGHKRLIQSILHHSKSVEQVIIWTDFDKSGSIIGRYLFEAVQPYSLRMKWIVPGEERVVDSWDEYDGVLQHVLETRSSEQEEQLEGGDTWKMWIKA